MSNGLLTYEHPLNERVRAFLRLEHLFEQINHYIDSQSHWDSRIALESIIEISNILERTDLRNETIKELERHVATLTKLSSKPSVNQPTLKNILDDLEHSFEMMHSSPGKASSSLREHEFLNGIRQRLTIPGGTCCFDIPAYHYWLNLTYHQRQEDMRLWVKTFNPIQHAVSLILHLIRNSTVPIQEIAPFGLYQKSLQPQTPCQLVSITLPASLGLYPEVSGSKHRITVRFLTARFDGSRGAQTSEDVPFEITRCTI